MSKLSPLEGGFLTLRELAEGLPKTTELRKDIFNNIIEDTIIDTCEAFDTNEWETGIWRHGEGWVIVEQYEDKIKAQKGHERWVEALIKQPDLELKDIKLWNIPH